MGFGETKGRKIKLGWLIVAGLLVGGGYHLYKKFSPEFEKIPPKVELLTNSNWTNLRKPIPIRIRDNRGIRYYSILAIVDGKVYELAKGEQVNKSQVDLNITLPNTIVSKSILIKVTAVDTSKWNFFAGNQIEKTFQLKVDINPPIGGVVAQSYAIGRGGCAVAIVKAKDENFKEAYIDVNKKWHFQLVPFLKKDYYIALIGWPITEKNFRATLVVEDQAGNQLKLHIPYYYRKYQYQNRQIKIPDNFVKSIAIPILERVGLPTNLDKIATFKLMNEKVREQNNREIAQLTKKVWETKFTPPFWVKMFSPLPGGKREAGFGDYRHYFIDGQEVSTAYHRGIDLAKVRNSKIYLSNPGVVVATKWIGIYGNTTIVYHQLGLYTLYAHQSQFLVQKGEQLPKGKVIGLTGKTGGVLGDHLHFGVYIQGVAVTPLEWMDPHFIKTSITDVINRAKKVILDEGKDN